MTIRHVVTWELAAENAETRAAQAAEIVRRLHALVGVVPSIRMLSAGANVVYPHANADVCVVADFDDVAGLDAYQNHPAHREVAAFVRERVSGRQAVDFEL